MTRYETENPKKSIQKYIKTPPDPDLKLYDLRDTARSHEAERELRKEHQRRKTR